MSDLNLCGLEVTLGSSSKWRRQLFKSRFPGLDFSTNSADIDETAVTAGYADRGSADPEILTLALAHAKADAILPKLSEGTLLITSDQVLSFKGTIREHVADGLTGLPYSFVAHSTREQKPSDASECREYLRSYKSEPAVTVTALVVTNTSASGRKRVECVDVAKQHFEPISEDVIDALIAKGDVLHSAGGFTVEDPLLAPFLGKRIGTEDSSKFLHSGGDERIWSRVIANLILTLAVYYTSPLVDFLESHGAPS